MVGFEALGYGCSDAVLAETAEALLAGDESEAWGSLTRSRAGIPCSVRATARRA
jgi:hypothetical protein